jgi:heme exporter protein D
MNWGSVDNFLHMGGNGLFVWGSYGMALLLMLAEPLLAASRRRRALNEAQEDQGS